MKDPKCKPWDLPSVPNTSQTILEQTETHVNTIRQHAINV